MSGKGLLFLVYVMFVYGSLDKSKHKVLWKELKFALPRDHNLCIIMGDFNTILSPNDKKNNHSIGKRCQLFEDFIYSCNL